MRIEWFGQSAFLVRGAERSVFVDPFTVAGETFAARGVEFGYPPIEGAEADLVLVTHEHADHNGVEAVGGDPVVIRSIAGRRGSPVGEVVAVASEHDDVAGTARGANTIFRFELDGLTLCHLGDFGQRALRPEQREAIGAVDVLFLPAGGEVTIGGEPAAAVVRELGPELVVPMHYRTRLVGFLEPPDAFLDALGWEVVRPEGTAFEVEPLLAGPRVVMPAPPGARAPG